MRIAYVYDSIYPFSKGGGERRIYEVAKRLSIRGHEVSILGMKYWDGPAAYENNGLHYRALSRRMDSHNRNGKRSAIQAILFGAASWRMIADRRYDVIDCGQFPFLHLIPAKASSVFRGTPFVVTWYEVLRNNWLKLFGKLGHAAMLAEKAFCRLPDRIVAISEATRTGLLEMGSQPERISVIPDGVDFEHILSVAPGRVRTDLVYCGRLKNFKNVNLMVEAVALLKSSRPDISAAIIGDGPESEALRNLAVRLGVARNITFTGALDNFDDVIAWLKSSRIFVHPSTKEGGSSMTLFEANASGLPVIAIRCSTGIDTRFIREGQNAFLVEPDAAQIANLALSLLNSPKQLASCAAASRDFAVEFDWSSAAAQYEQLYSSLLPSRAS